MQQKETPIIIRRRDDLGNHGDRHTLEGSNLSVFLETCHELYGNGRLLISRGNSG